MISTGHPVQLAVQLEEEPIELTDDVTVTGSLFTRPREIVVNRYAMSYEEIRRAPGGIGDISRVMQAMPGIVPTSDQRNDLVVRGGSPAENLTIVDNVEIPNLSHFGAQGATGGPISMLNTEFVREASFLAGGFPAMYGNRLSSVLERRTARREPGEPERHVRSRFRGRRIHHGRRTSAHAVHGWSPRAAATSICSPATTDSPPSRSTATTRQRPPTTSPMRTRLWFISLGGIDQIDFAYDPTETKEPSSLAVNSGGWRTISGLNWQWLWGTAGYGTLGISDALEGYEQDARDNDLNMVEVFANRRATVRPP